MNNTNGEEALMGHEIRALRDTLNETTKKLDEAESALIYYANINNYGKRPNFENDYQDILQDDWEQISKTTFIAGYRARKYLALYKKE